LLDSGHLFSQIVTNSKVGEIFLAAGSSYSKLGDAVMSLYNCSDEQDVSPAPTKTTKTTEKSASGAQTFISKHPPAFNFKNK